MEDTEDLYPDPGILAGLTWQRIHEFANFVFQNINKYDWRDLELVRFTLY